MLLALALSCAMAGPDTLPLWGDLEPGRYAVGFASRTLRDLSRPRLDGATPDLGPGGRTVRLYLWYPARVRTGARLRFGDYLDAGAGAGAFAAHAAELGGDSLEIRATLPELGALATAARRGARPATGRHPLVLFPAYRSPATTAVLAEYLASHGIVVAVIEMTGTSEPDPEISLSGLETQVADLRVALAELAAEPFVDATRLAAMGVGFNASAALSLQLRHPGVRSLVSLDGGIPTQFEDRFLKRTPYFDPAAVRIPILAIHSPHASIDTSLWNQYRYADRSLLHFPGMTEFHFLSFGPLARFAPGIIAKATGDPVVGFGWAARYVERFLAWTLRGNAAAERFVRGAPATNGVPAGLVTAARKSALPAPPTFIEAKRIIVAGGVDSLMRLVDALRMRDSTPLTHERIAEIFTWISFGRDPESRGRERLTRLRVALYPRSSRAQFTLGHVLTERGDTAAAIGAFQEALRLLPADDDPALDPSLRARVDRGSRDALGRLTGGAPPPARAGPPG
jgi:hypothetical protein